MLSVLKHLGSNISKPSVNKHLHTSNLVFSMNLSAVVNTLREIAPLHLAEDWDNVGLLLEPSSPPQVTKALLTNDLTEPVMTEALKNEVQIIIAYHPIIFSPLKRLTQSSWKERILISCLENKVAVYSPHTSWDAIEGGINDWLLKPFDISNKRVIHGTQMDFSEVEISSNRQEDITIAVNLLLSKGVIKAENREGYIKCMGGIHKELIEVDARNLTKMFDLLKSYDNVSIVNRLGIKKEFYTTGGGRYVDLKAPIKLQDAVDSIKKHLKLDHVMLAIGKNKTIESPVSSIAVCAGSGASVLQRSSADLLLTGEMSHHIVLDAVAKGSTVLLTCHSNSERGFLTDMAQVLAAKMSGVEILVSAEDADPLNIV